MLTLRELEIRDFQHDRDGQVIKTGKNNSPVSVSISNNDFMDSKPYWTNNKIVTQNAHDIMEDIRNVVGNKFPDQSWGQTYVYRDKVDIHGYIDSKKDQSQFPVLHPDVPISELAFSRVITKMTLFGDDKYNAAICMKWEPKELQIAIGTNVRVCDNFNILGANVFLKTNRGLNYDSLRHELMFHISEIEERFGRSIESINRMIETPMDGNRARFVLGDLMTKYDMEQPVINFTDLHEVSREITRFEKIGQPIKNVWDLVNIGTDVLKFDKNAGESSFEHIQQWNRYFENLN